VGLIRKNVLAAFVLILVIGAIATVSIVYLRQTPHVRQPFEWSYNVDYVYHEDGLTPDVWTVDSARVTVVNRMQTNVTIPWVASEVKDVAFPDGKSERLDRQTGNYSMVSGSIRHTMRLRYPDSRCGQIRTLQLGPRFPNSQFQ